MAGKNVGRSGRRYRSLKAQIRATETHCFRCGQPIDWSIPYRDAEGNVNLASGSVEHKQTRSGHLDLAEDRGNLGASHLDCNLKAGDRDPRPGLGLRSREW